MQHPDATPLVKKFEASRAAVTELGWSTFVHTPQTTSTNADLVAACRATPGCCGVHVTDHQTAGRGRLDRRWEDVPGRQLLVSIAVPVVDLDASVVAAAVAVAACECVRAMGGEVGLKWPNDVVADVDGRTRKLAGLLAEFVDGRPPTVVVGLGMNVEAIAIEGSVSLVELGVDRDRDAVLAEVVRRLPPLLADPDGVRQRMRAHSATLGRQVRIERHDGHLRGEAVDIDHDGRLVVAGPDGEVVVSVGDVVHLRPVEG